MKKLTKVLISVLALTLVMAFMPAMAFADDAAGAAKDIKVYLTVSDEGTIAKANDDSLMVNKAVTVTDLDANGSFSYDEALVAAHKAYNSEDGYAVTSGGFGQKIWGVDNGGSYLFFRNDVGIPSDLITEKVEDGEYLTAAILKDTKNYSDWYAAFDKKNVVGKVGDSVTLNLRGHLGMAYTDETKKDVPLAGITVKDAEGKEVGKTDEKGNITVKADKAGVQTLIAEGVVPDVSVEVWGMPGDQIGEKYVMSEMDWSTYESFILYTEKDYGDGPYPADEIKKMDFMDYNDLEDAEKAAYHWVYASKYESQTSAYYPVKVDAPMTAAAAKIKTGENIKAFVSVEGKQVLKNKDVLVYDENESGGLDAHDALYCIHEANAPNKANDYAEGAASWGGTIITKLWGVESSAVMYYINNEMASGLDAAIKAGDTMYAFVMKDATGYSDAYAYFDKTSASAKVGKALSLTLTANGYDKDYNVVSVAPGASVGYYSGSKFVSLGKANASGKVSLKFTKVGTYELTAEGADGTILVPPYCKVTVAKGDNPMTAKAKTVKIKVKKLKKKAQTIKKTKAFTVKKNQGKVTFKKVKGNKKIIVSKAGKVTVKKGLKKGTYKVVVTVKAAGNANYKAASKKVTLKIKVV